MPEPVQPPVRRFNSPTSVIDLASSQSQTPSLDTGSNAGEPDGIAVSKKQGNEPL